jgi:hypothetical protein
LKVNESTKLEVSALTGPVGGFMGIVVGPFRLTTDPLPLVKAIFPPEVTPSRSTSIS